MRTARPLRLTLFAIAALVPATLVACTDASSGAAGDAPGQSTGTAPEVADPPAELEIATVTAADGPSEFAIAMGGVDPQIAAAYEERGDPLEIMGSEARTDRFEYLAFYPEHVQVHRGDRIRFMAEGFHSALVFTEPDEAPGFHTRGPTEDVIAIDGGGRPTDPSCISEAVDVAPGVEPCVLDDPGARFSTGFNSALVELDLPPGAYSFVCGVHADMTGTIEVVADEEPIPAPSEVDIQRREEQAQDTANAEAVMAQHEGPRLAAEGDTRVWELDAGTFTEDGRVAIIRFMPGDVTIAEGDEVRFVMPDSAGYEVHTVTFPADGYPAGIATYFTPEFGIQPFAWREPQRAPDDTIVDGTTRHDSGWLGQAGRDCPWVCDPWTDQRWPSETAVRFAGPGTYSYVCLIHPERGMRGSITVVPA